jgi:2-C-methyl-D-erythritol 4-phosphate cytidylyltransferase / 2-C-methyl-D-erythritol 2,4-cyclodiphosphate synthase
MKLALSVVIAAGGSGSRFKRAGCFGTSKLALPLNNGKSVLEESISAFGSIPEIREVIVAAHPDLRSLVKVNLLREKRYSFPIRVIPGGATRSESVWRSLQKTSAATSHVLIHDGARPLVRPEWIRKLIKELEGVDGVVLGRPAVPTVKRVSATGDILETLNRGELFEAETPQIFKKEILKQAYSQLGRSAFQATDDASLVEMIGGTVKAVPHEGSNLKITTPEDLVMARNILSGSGSSGLRFGLGFDTHRLVSGRPFCLGGVRIKSDVGPLGHSDGDPLLHAVIDGMLGASGLGDIGDFFSDRDVRFKNIASSMLARRALILISQKGFCIAQMDTTVFLERPKLGTYKKKIQSYLSKLFSLPLDCVGVKAKTAEGLGPEGRGQAVSAQALVVLRRKGENS